MLITLCATLGALVADKLFGEPVRWHPLVAFGRFADGLQKPLSRTKLAGLMAWLIAVLPLVASGWALEGFLSRWEWLYGLASGVILYSALGWQSLLHHANNVITPLAGNDLTCARRAVAMMVSRDTENLTAPEVAGAATESVLENGSDAIFAALFWFWVGGIPAVILYRLANTLDAMWGYKSDCWREFGWAAARIDDLLNWLPARLTAASYAFCGNARQAIACWRTQARCWKSPNAGPVMASGAGAIGVHLGGAATYHNQLKVRPSLGVGSAASDQTIKSACKLINRAVVLWVSLLTLLTILLHLI